MNDYHTHSPHKVKTDNTAMPLNKTPSAHAIPETYLLSMPFLIGFITYHPESEESAYVFTAIAPDNASYFSATRNAFHSRVNPPLHRTNFYELYFVIHGSMFQNIENQRHLYPAGSCVLLSRDVRHVIEYSSDFRAVSLQLSDAFMTDLFSVEPYFQTEQNETVQIIRRFFLDNMTPENVAARNYIDFIPRMDENWIRENIHALFERIVNETLNPGISSSHIIRALFLELLFRLFHPDNFSNTPISLGNSGEKELFEEITKYMKARNGRVSRKELTEVFHYSGNYIYKIIHKYTGLSVFEYGMTFCLREAARLLDETTMTTQAISLSLRFQNRSHFYQLFKDMYGMTPREYRKRAR